MYHDATLNDEPGMANVRSIQQRSEHRTTSVPLRQSLLVRCAYRSQGTYMHARALAHSLAIAKFEKLLCVLYN